MRQINEGREAVQALRELSDSRRELGRDDEALKLYEEAVAVCRDVGDPLLLAHTIRHLGQLHHDAARVEEAERCYREALELYRGHESAPPLDVAQCGPAPGDTQGRRGRVGGCDATVGGGARPLQDMRRSGRSRRVLRAAHPFEPRPSLSKTSARDVTG